MLNYGCFILNADHVYRAIDAFPINAHPMTQFSTGVMALQVNILTALQNLSSFHSGLLLLAVFMTDLDGWFL